VIVTHPIPPKILSNLRACNEEDEDGVWTGKRLSLPSGAKAVNVNSKMKEKDRRAKAEEKRLKKIERRRAKRELQPKEAVKSVGQAAPSALELE
jgi:hypothetical protein